MSNQFERFGASERGHRWLAARLGVRKSAGVVVLALCSFLSVPASRGQNLLPNAGFNTNTSGWSGTPILAWSSLDAKGSSGSGSLQMTVNNPTDNNGFYSATFCVAVTPGQTYHQGASFYFPGGQSHDAGFALILYYFTSATCSGTFLGDVGADALPAVTNTWTRLDTQPNVAPAGANSVEVAFGVRPRSPADLGYWLLLVLQLIKRRNGR
jgi:hypothetical protein